MTVLQKAVGNIRLGVLTKTSAPVTYESDIGGGRDPFGQHQGSRPMVGPDFFSMRRVLVWYFQPVRFARFYNVSVNGGLPMLEPARGLDSWC